MVESTKGLAVSAEFVTSLIISVFIVVVIITLFLVLLPAQTAGSCQLEQAEEINGLINNAIEASSTYDRDFRVFSCTEIIDFTYVVCDPPDTGRKNFGNDYGEQRCYRMMFSGDSNSNCDEMGVINTFPPTDIGSDVCGDLNLTGTLRTIPGSKDFVEIEPFQDHSLLYRKGVYSVRISPFSIKFMEPSN